jgi:anti-sigma B factor antagonist
MIFESSQHQGVLVIRLIGNLKTTRENYAVLDQVRTKLAEGQQKVVIDLGGIGKIDSGGVGILASMVSSADDAGARLALACLPEKVERVIGIVGMLHVLNIHETVDEAVTSML